MKRLISLLLAILTVFSFTSCGLIAKIGRSIFNQGNTDGGITSPVGGFDAEYSIDIGESDSWMPFPNGSSVTFDASSGGVIRTVNDGKTVTFIGVKAGEAAITAACDGATAYALIKVAGGAGNDGANTKPIWTEKEVKEYSKTFTAQVGAMEKELEKIPDDKLQITLLSYANDMANAVSAGYVPPELTAKAGAIAYIYPHPLLLNNYAGMLVTAGQLELAKQVYLFALEQTPNDAYLLVNLGEVYFTQGFMADAENCATKALDAQPQFALAYQLMTSIHLEHADYVLAIETMLKGAMDNWNEVCQAQFEALYSAIMELDPAKDEYPINALNMELLFDVITLDATGEKRPGIDTPEQQQRFDWSYPPDAKFAGEQYRSWLQHYSEQFEDTGDVDNEYIEKITKQYEEKILAAAAKGDNDEVIRLNEEMQKLLADPLSKYKSQTEKDREKFLIRSFWTSCPSLRTGDYIQEEYKLQNAATARNNAKQNKIAFHSADENTPSLEYDYNYIAHLSLFSCGYAIFPQGAGEQNPELLNREWTKKYTAQSTEYQPGSRQYYCLELLQQYYDFQILKAYSKLDRAKLEKTVTEIGELHTTYKKRYEELHPIDTDEEPFPGIDYDLESGETKTVLLYPRKKPESAAVMYLYWEDYYKAAGIQYDFFINTLRSNYEKELQPLLEEYWLKMNAALSYVYDAEMQSYYLNLRTWLCMRYVRILHQEITYSAIGETMMQIKDQLDEAREAYEIELEKKIEDMMREIYAAQEESAEALKKAIEKYLREGPTRVQPYDKDDNYSLYASMNSPSFFGYSAGMSVAGSEVNFFVTSPYGERRITYDPGKDNGENLQSTCFTYGGTTVQTDQDARQSIKDSVANMGYDTLEKAAEDAFKANKMPFEGRLNFAMKLGKIIPKVENDEKTGRYVSRSLTTGKVTDAGNFSKRTSSVGIGDMGVSQETLERVPYNIVMPKKTQAHVKASGKFFSLGGQVESNY